MEPKKIILSYIEMNPGVKTEEIILDEISRASLGLHLRNLMDSGLLIRTQDKGWHLSSHHIMDKPENKLSSMDIVDTHIRKMILGN